MGSVGKWCWLLALLLIARSGTSQTSGNAAVPETVAGQQEPDASDRSHPIPSTVDNDNDNDKDKEHRGWLDPGVDPENRLLSPFVKHIVTDQKQFWMSPAHFQIKDLKWILPGAATAAVFVATDSWLSKQVPASHMATSKTFSDYSTYSFIGLGGASFLLGKIKGDDHLSEAGLLAGEAAINATAVAYAFKEITQRQRPYLGNGHGDFFVGGSSFPSEHSAVAWSVASVWAHEYPGWFSQMAAYGLASAVTLTRVTAKQHFPSDAIIGSALGWYFGRQVYRAHHDPEVGGSAWGSFFEERTGEKARNPGNMGSPYVPLDSWVYPALDRLAALGYVQSAYLGMRPWTRMACAHLIEEAGDRLQDEGAGSGAADKIYEALTTEFRDETARLGGAANVGVGLDSIYTRFTGISGTPLRDGYHFAQTIVNDYGRPYGEGFNSVTGSSAHAVLGPLAFYVRGEYQHAPGSSSDPAQALQGIAAADLTTPLASDAVPEADRFQLLEGTAALAFHNTQLSFGKQSLWLGPGEAGPLLFSNNADPMMMVKIDDVEPYRIPLLSSLLGPVRTEYFLGQLSGHRFEFNPVTNTLIGPGGVKPQPYLQGYKISFKPIPDLEIGMGFTAQFAGPGLPFTWQNFLRAVYSHTSTGTNPGKRLSAADFSYRMPGLRKWLTFYGDTLVVDEISPIGSSRATVSPGIYLPQIPKVPNLEFRAEYLRTAQTHEFAPGFVYYGLRRYRSGYTNEGNLLASWIGRAGTGGQAWMTYSFSPRTRIQLGYRLQDVNKDFIEGGRLADYSARGELTLSSGLALSGYVQYEQWKFPILSATGQSNVTASFQFAFYPHWGIRK